MKSLFLNINLANYIIIDGTNGPLLCHIAAYVASYDVRFSTCSTCMGEELVKPIIINICLIMDSYVATYYIVSWTLAT